MSETGDTGQDNVKGRFPRQFLYTFLASGLAMVFGILTSVVVARSLGPEGKGAYAVAIRAIGILIGISQFGLPEVMLFQMRTDRRRPSELAANSLLIVVAGTALAAAIFWTTYSFLEGSLYSGVARSVMWLAFLILPFNLAFIFFSRLIQLDGRLGTYNLIMLASKATGLIGIILCLRVRPGDPGATILGLVLSTALVGILSLILVRSRVAPHDWRIDLPLLGESVRGGFKVQWAMLAHLLNQYMGVFILNYFLDLQNVGWFSTAMGLATFVLLLPQAVRTVLQSWMPSAAASPQQITDRTVILARHTAIILCLAALALLVLGKPLIRFMYGSQFEPSYVPMVILLGGIVARGVGQIVVSHLAFEGYLGLAGVAGVLGVMVNISLAWVLVPTVGMWGAALATTAGHLTHTLFLIYWFLRKNSRHFVEFVPRASDVQLYTGFVKARMSL